MEGLLNDEFDDDRFKLSMFDDNDDVQVVIFMIMSMIMLMMMFMIMFMTMFMKMPRLPNGANAARPVDLVSKGG